MTKAQAPDTLLDVVLDGNYRANRYIGRGAMGTIYEGTHLRLNKRVALKVISRDLSSNPHALSRFRREAEVTSQLGHPHIVNVFDFGTTPSGEPYMAMEFLDGEDLEARLRRGERLPLDRVTLIVRQVASALAATHGRGIVHRDLKPANVFLVRIEGEPEFAKVVDFGISKVLADATRITRANVALGTPQFMSPEQSSGNVDEVNHHTDQWSLACIAFEALSGRLPFVASNSMAMLYKVLHEDPPDLPTLVPGLPAALGPVIRRALAKRPADRYENITAFARAFEAAATGVIAESVRPSGGIEVAYDADDRTVLDDRAPGEEWPSLPPPVREGEPPAARGDEPPVIPLHAVRGDESSHVFPPVVRGDESLQVVPAPMRGDESRAVPVPAVPRRLVAGLGAAGLALVAFVLWQVGRSPGPAPAPTPSPRSSSRPSPPSPRSSLLPSPSPLASPSSPRRLAPARPPGARPLPAAATPPLPAAAPPPAAAVTRVPARIEAEPEPPAAAPASPKPRKARPRGKRQLIEEL